MLDSMIIITICISSNVAIIRTNHTFFNNSDEIITSRKITPERAIQYASKLSKMNCTSSEHVNGITLSVYKRIYHK